MVKLVSVAEMIAIEKAADAAGPSYRQMMENAGQALANTVSAHSHQRGRSVLGLVGPGNNGGDTLVALAALAAQGWMTSAYLVKREFDEEYARRAADRGTELFASSADQEFSWLKNALQGHAILLEGLLGTGIRLPLREPFTQVLHATKTTLAGLETGPYVVAVDCPSGIDCDSGEVPSEALKADLTVCMAAIKRGMLTLPAFEWLGELEVSEIGLPDELPAWAAVQRFALDEGMARSALPNRPWDAHKGTFGTALIVAGSQRFPGAALLAGKAAYGSGAGLVTMAVPESMQRGMLSYLPEATWLPLPTEDGWISAGAAKVIKTGLKGATAVLIGPGFGQQEGTGAFLTKLLKEELPALVMDADALKLLAGMKDWPKQLPPGTVLTPHPGEMSTLSGLTKEKIQASRVETAEKFARKWRQVVVLKGAFTVIAAPDGRSAVMPLATPALARAGTGDVLAGIITGLRAQGVAAFEAACAGVWLHGQAGLRAAARLGGTAGVLAGDLIGELPALIGK